MNSYFIISADGRVRTGTRTFYDILQTFRNDFADEPSAQIFFAPTQAVDRDGYLVMDMAIGLVNMDGLITPLSGDDYLPDLPRTIDAIGLMSTTALQSSLSDPCPSCDAFGDADPDNPDTAASCCRLCGGGGTLGDAILLALHRAARLEQQNPLVGLIAHLLRGDSISIGPRRMPK